MPVVPVFASIRAEHHRYWPVPIVEIIGTRRGFQVVYPSRIIIVSAAYDEPQALVRAESPAVSRAELSQSASVDDRRVAARFRQAEKRHVAGAPRHQVDRSTDRVAILIGRESLVDLDRLYQVRG